MMFAFCAGDLAGGCVYVHLLILTGMRLVLCWSSGPIYEDVMSEGLDIKLAFPGGAEESVPVSFIQNGNGAASTAHTLMDGEFGDVGQYRGSSDVICRDEVWRRLSCERVQNVLDEAGREVLGHIVGIVTVGARFAACHSDAGFCSKAGQVRGKVQI